MYDWSVLSVSVSSVCSTGRVVGHENLPVFVFRGTLGVVADRFSALHVIMSCRQMWCLILVLVLRLLLDMLNDCGEFVSSPFRYAKAMLAG